MVCELLIPNMAIRNLIREDKLHQIYSMMQSGQGTSGMQTMNQALINLVKEGKVSKHEAVGYSPMPEELEKAIQGLK